MQTLLCCVIIVGVLVSTVQCQSGFGEECEDYEYPIQQQILYTRLQKALLGNPGNLYTLRNAFFPPLSKEPIVVAVAYYILFTYRDNITSNSYSCVSSGSNDTVFPIVKLDLVWTSSAVFSVIDPYVLELLQPAVLYILSPVTSSYYGNRGTDADLYMLVEDLPFYPTLYEVYEALNELTTLLKSYTNRQGKLENWYSDYPRGFTTAAAGDEIGYGIFYLLSVLLLVVTVLALVRLLYISELFQNYLRRALKGQKPHSVLFASIYIATAIMNLGFIVSETYGVSQWLDIRQDDSYTENTVGVTLVQAQITVLSKYFAYLFCCGISFFLALHLATRSQFTSNLPKQIKVITMLCSCGCLFFWWIGRCKHKVQQNIYKTLIAWNYLMLFVILAWNFHPTIVIILARPVETIAVISLIFSLYFMIAFGIAIALAYPAHKCINISLSIIVGLIVALLLTMFLLIIRAGFGTGGTIEALITFGPILIAAGIGWLSKKFLAHYATDPEESDEDNSSDEGPKKDENPSLTDKDRDKDEEDNPSDKDHDKDEEDDSSDDDSERGNDIVQNSDTGIELDSYPASEETSSTTKQFVVQFIPVKRTDSTTL